MVGENCPLAEDTSSERRTLEGEYSLDRREDVDILGTSSVCRWMSLLGGACEDPDEEGLGVVTVGYVKVGGDERRCVAILSRG